MVSATNIVLHLQRMNTILDRGFRFNLHQNPKHWLKTLDLEAGSAISYQLLAIYLPFIKISLEFK